MRGSSSTRPAARAERSFCCALFRGRRGGVLGFRRGAYVRGETGEGAKKTTSAPQQPPTVLCRRYQRGLGQRENKKMKATPNTVFIGPARRALLRGPSQPKKRSRDEDDFVAFAKRELEARSLVLDDMILSAPRAAAGKCPAHIAAVVGGVLGQEVRLAPCPAESLDEDNVLMPRRSAGTARNSASPVGLAAPKAAVARRRDGSDGLLSGGRNSVNYSNPF